ncbi:MAG: methionyl-tRNA formyltransferase, partial [Lachnospiraceae bacterium]
MKIVFMGTPEFAAAALEALIRAGHEITAVVTQPDKPKGRGRQMQFPPVKECAIQHGLRVLQPVKIKTPEAVAELKQIEADIFVVAAFGQILSSEILHMPRFGCVNIHASLLPKYRGAAPIQWAILNGETQTGVTIMQMDEGLDTGDMLTKVVVPIADHDTGDSLHDKLMEAGAKLIVDTLVLIEQGKVVPEKQTDEESCYASRLTKELGRIDWTKSAKELARLVRGLNSWPGSYATFRNKILKIWEAEVQEGGAQTADATGDALLSAGQNEAAAGTVVEV